MSYRYSESTASTNCRNGHRQDAFAALTGERPPSLLAPLRLSRTGDEAYRSYVNMTTRPSSSSSNRRSERSIIRDAITPDDSISVVMERSSQAPRSPRRTTGRHSRRSSPRSSRRSSHHSRPSEYKTPGSDWSPRSFSHKNSVEHLRRRGTSHASADDLALDRAMRGLDIADESEPETPRVPSRQRSPSRSAANSSASRHSRSSRTRPESRPRSSVSAARSDLPSGRHFVPRDRDIAEEDEAELYSPKDRRTDSSSRRSHRSTYHYDPEDSSDDTAPTSSSLQYEQSGPRRSGRSSLASSSYGMNISRRPSGRLQVERPSRRHRDSQQQHTDGDVPRWALWFAGV